MEFYTISQQQTTNAIADAVVVREVEIHSYDMNIANYEIMIAALPSEEWPSNMEQYRYARLSDVPDELDSTVSTYQYRDYLKNLLKTEKQERNKSVRIYEALISRIPEADRATAIAAAFARVFPNA